MTQTDASGRSPQTLWSLPVAQSKLRKFAEQIDSDPLTNSVFALARELFSDLEGERADLETMETLTGDIFQDLIEQRALRFRDQHFDKTGAPVTDLSKVLEKIAAQGFEVFKTAVETLHGGVVFTAHPTFALPLKTREAFAAYAEAPKSKTRKSLAAAVAEDARAWSASISLLGEHAEVQTALVNARAALRSFASSVLGVAAKAFPDQWRGLKLTPPTLASWVGYDLDGRTDIHWSQSVAIRLREKAAQLTYYQGCIDAISEQTRSAAGLADMSKRVGKAADMAEQRAALFDADIDDPDTLIGIAKQWEKDTPEDIVSSETLLTEIDKSVAAAEDALAKDLLILRAEIEALQLGTARIHLRLNAAQVRTVISRDLGLETEDSRLGRIALKQLTDLARTVPTQSVGLADLYLEQSTARRQFMMCALILNKIDARSPIRFLIAESENPATVMGALYLARQYGVDGSLDISPLFETPEALGTGGRFVERLLEEEEFLKYLRSRGHLSIQLGFSDAGRFIGQVAANMAIERIHNLISRALSRKDKSLGLLIFNTHGESMGRGAWPGTFTDRFNHALSPWTRCNAKKRGIRLLHEVSFQGGDGFLHFATPGLAHATYAAYCEHLLSEPDLDEEDPFYSRTDFVWDFYRTLRNWQEELYNDADYARLLSDFATNFLVTAGSRQRRRTGGPGGPRSLRAISHNATLQQLGVPVNTAAGIGTAAGRESDRLIELIDASPRMRGLIMLALQARILTSVPALRAYAYVYDPDYWVAISKFSKSADTAAYRRVYTALKEGQTASSLRRSANLFAIDLEEFDWLLGQLKGAPSAEERHERRLNLHILHAVRQALMMQALTLVGRLPPISERHGCSREDILEDTQAMRLKSVVEVLCSVFPAATHETKQLRNMRKAKTEQSTSGGYDHIHSDIIQPLARIDQLMHATSLALSQAYNAYG